jgi:signal transduction histidine kinase
MPITPMPVTSLVSGALERPRVLIVDDSTAQRAWLSRGLRDGHAVTLASGGAAALEIARREPFDVVLLDLMMPDPGGLEVCARLKSWPETEHIPVIMMTGATNTEDRVASIEAGADDFLLKPFAAIDLLARIRSMVRVKRQFDRLNHALQAREQLSQMLVHDLRSPLTSMTLALDLLRSAESREESEEYIDRLSYDVDRANTFLTELLIVAKMESGRFALSLRSQSMVSVLARSVEANQLVARSRGLSLRVAAPSDLPPCTFDPTLIERVLDNLISNACKHSPRNEAVVLHVSMDASPGPGERPCLRVSVTDQGAGVPPEHRATLFGRFQSFASHAYNGPRFGLGLSFCKMAIEAHGGTIAYEPNLPRGSIFSFTIPC